MSKILYDNDDKGIQCLECFQRPRKGGGIPSIIHHERCLTGQWEDARRDKKIYIAPNPRPFRIKPGSLL